ncbi:MAG: LPS-assembly protein LptD [Methylococcaceae bacterium]|nr:LPS-assembly protein LptD [Methylococcaceae bacterium]
MLRRLFLFFLPSISVNVSLASEASWDCQQSKDNKEWVCVGDKKPVAAETQVKPQTTQEKPSTPSNTVEKNVPAPVKAVENAEPIENKKIASNPAVTKFANKPSRSNVLATRKPASIDVKPETKEPTAQGWTCGAKGNDEQWDCKLVGADPKGQAQVVKSESYGFSLLEPAFDHRQEQTFRTLTSNLPHDPWENCTVHMGTGHEIVRGKDLRTSSPLDVKSDYSEIFDNEIGSYYGNVEMNRGDQRSSSHTANYDSVSETLDLQGGVYYSEDELALYSESATLKLASDQAKLRDTLFIAPTTPIRGRAKVVYRDNKDLSRYKQVAYTSCKPGNQDWVVHASELKVNYATGKGAAKNAWLEAKGLPVFYLPYLSFPIDDRRLSGFLAPSYNYTQTGGFSINVPYYWNIAPNYDATFNPKYFAKRGMLLGANFRYLFEKTRGNLAFEILPYDSVRDRSRFLGSFKNHARLTDHISSNMDLNYVSDKDYFSELGNALSFTNFSFIKSTADVNYIREGVSLIGRFVNYQSVDPTLSDVRLPYKRLPQVNFNLNHSFKFMPLDTALDSEYVYFQHNNLIDGQRVNVKPSISFPLHTTSAFLTPKMSLQHTQYELNNLSNTGYAPGTPTNVGTASTISRTLPIFSVDSGLFFERDVNMFKTALTHTLEPRLFYLYIPYKDQSNIPAFDSSLYDFWFNSLYRENRFSGSDRVQDANQLSAAITSRLIDPASGRERLRLDLGEIVYFRDRRVTAPIVVRGFLQPTPPETSTWSNFVAELGSEINRHVAIETGIQWNPQNSDVERGKAILHLTNEPNELFNIGYMYRKNPLVTNLNNGNRVNDIIQSDVSFRWPVYDDWYAIGRWQYSLLYNRTQESFLGLEKENCCWRFRIIGRHYVNGLINTAITDANAQAAQGVSQTGVFFQIELKGLTGLGQKLDEFFEQNISGYRKSE